MKIYIFTFFLISSTIIGAQELDEAFLESLPKDMQKDIEEQAKGNSENEDPVYRSIQNQTKLEKQSLDAPENEDDLFGSSFFRTYQSTYMPINEPNLSPSYILDYGDYLRIQLIGERNETENYMISRDGSINIENLEPIVLSGLNLEDATKVIKSRVNSSFIGTEAYITLSLSLIHI